MAKKIRVGIIFGGKSAEHEVSLQSAKNIIDAIDKEKFEPVPIGIAKSGEWYLSEAAHFLLDEHDPNAIRINYAENVNSTVALLTGEKYGQLVRARTHEPVRHIDVYFPVLHGPMGEDGTMQGLLKLANVPFVGAAVLGSAIGMDKDVMKRLYRDAGIPIPKFITVESRQRKEASFDLIVKELGVPFFVKPANLGSSVGVHRVTSAKEFESALDDAFHYDHKVIVEEEIKGREIECAVLGNQEPIASVVGEIKVQSDRDFYSYEAKYTDEEAAQLLIPADIPIAIAEQVRELAVRAFRVACCEGMARVDFFLRGDEVLVNEINTIPGFTRVSMYPKLWEASGITYSELIERLIELAIERYGRDQKLKTSRDD